MTQKDKKIIEDCERNKIPMFVFTAKDICSVPPLLTYLQECTLEGCNQDHKNGIVNRIDEFREWQIKNKDLVKTPD